jgi:uncharacterized membrane protein YphA (DoxX/SURF4 family)
MSSANVAQIAKKNSQPLALSLVRQYIALGALVSGQAKVFATLRAGVAPIAKKNSLPLALRLVRQYIAPGALVSGQAKVFAT